MNVRYFIIIGVSSFMLYSVTLAATDSRLDPQWGIGIICRVDNKFESDKTSFPSARIPAYKMPNGSRIGVVERGPASGNPFTIFIITDHDKLELKPSDVIEVTTEGTVLKYYEQAGAFINIAINTLDGGVWVHQEDLEKNNYKVQKWLDFLTSSKREFYYRNNNIDLKSSPDSQSQTITKIKGQLYHIKFMGKFSGRWAEVEVKQYNMDPNYDGGKIIRKMDGWIEAIDEKGKPRIWYFTRD